MGGGYAAHPLASSEKQVTRGVKPLTHWPVLVDVLGDVRGRVVGGEEELFRLPAHQDQPEIDLEAQTQAGEIRIDPDETL